MLFEEDTIKKILSKGDLVKEFGIVAKKGIKRKEEDFFIINCPFHKETEPSMYIDNKNQVYHCYGCGETGNIINLNMIIKGISFEQAVIGLANRMRINLNTSENEIKKSQEKMFEINKIAAGYYYKTLLSDNGKEGRKYFEQRQLSNNIIKKFGLGYSGGFGTELYDFLKAKGFNDNELISSGLIGYGSVYKNGVKENGYYDKFWNRVMFPIMDYNNKVIGFGGRILTDAKPKYLNSQETTIFSKSNNLYGLNLARYSKKPYFIICEGYMDVISMHQAGFTNAVASLGTALTKEQVQMISKLVNEVCLAYDSDDAGVSAALKAVALFNEANVKTKVINMNPYKDPDEFTKNLGNKAFEERVLNAEDGNKFLLRNIKNTKGKEQYFSEVLDILTFSLQ